MPDVKKLSAKRMGLFREDEVTDQLIDRGNLSRRDLVADQIPAYFWNNWVVYLGCTSRNRSAKDRHLIADNHNVL